MADGTRGPETHVYSPELEEQAARVLRAAEKRRLRITTAESCTGGALAALLTDVEGLSHVFERGFAVYCNEAKSECLGVPADVIVREGAVSRAVAEEMAKGALAHSHADIAVAITGNAGPAGPREEEGLVYICVRMRAGQQRIVEHHFGAVGRARVRMKALESAMHLIDWAVTA
jgi:nicotinamide-nucleotide amidase